MRVTAKTGWAPPGTTVTVAGLRLPGGMLYLGRGLKDAKGWNVEPALIDPSLKVDLRNPNYTAAGVDYWPSYSGLTARARAGYLHWLADGRRAPHAPISWAFLFFYGLERRALIEAETSQKAQADRPAIAAEVRRLLSIYGSINSFRQYANGFLDVLEGLGGAANPVGPADEVPPGRDDMSWQHVPASLRRVLAHLATTSEPVPADWALSWVLHHPTIYLRTPASRCADEFDTLFRARYTARFGEGLTVRDAKTRVTIPYNPASGGISFLNVSTEIADVVTQAAPTKKLGQLAEECQQDLDAYSRYLGRNPESRGDLASAAMLPAELATMHTSDDLQALHHYIDRSLGGQDRAVVAGADLIGMWPAKTPGKLAKAEAVALAQLLAAHGVGLVPDVRLGGPVLSAETSAVIFAAGPDQPAAPTAEYTATVMLLQLAAAVSTSDGVVDAETDHMAHHLRTAMGLTAAERVRLDAHTTWLLANPVKTTGLTRKLTDLTPARREAIGAFAVAVAAADGHVSRAEVTTLRKVYKLLGLDPMGVYGAVHAATTGASISPTKPGVAPVVVRPQTPDSTGFTIPPPPVESAPPPPVHTFVIDPAAVAAKLAETAQVSALLGQIFTDDDDPQPPAAATPDAATGSTLLAAPTAQQTTPAATAPTIDGLDAAHTALLVQLATRGTWSRLEYEAECVGHGLMPDGAVDTINDAALDLTGAPVLDGDDPIHLDLDIAQEILP